MKEAAVDPQQVPPLVLKELGIRIEPAMASYIARQLAAGAASQDPIPVIGGDARTGVPVRGLLKPQAIHAGLGR